MIYFSLFSSTNSWRRRMIQVTTAINTMLDLIRLQKAVWKSL